MQSGGVVVKSGAARFRLNLLFLLLTTPALGAAGAPQLVVTVTGGQLRGTLLSPKGAVFKGVPYAQPPVGALRWREPAPVQPWTGVRDAGAYGPPCAQNPYFIHDAKETSREDCLYLNVWTPVWPRPSAKLAVMVWIPGGGNFAGAAAPEAPGDQLIRKGVILVTFNYRLGLFGFFSHPELTKASPHHASGNQAFLDQIAALHWVQNNIAKFGGDPGNVTIFGESAGSFNVSALMTSPLIRGLFRRAIGESGAVVIAAGDPTSLFDAEKRDLALAATWIPGGNTSLAALRALPTTAILAKEPNLLAEPLPSLGLIVDGYVFSESPAAAFAAGREQPVELLHGSLAHEWRPGLDPPADLNHAIDAAYPAAIAPRVRTLYRAAPTDSLYGTPAQQWLEDISFRCPSEEQLLWHVAAGNRAYEYQFDRLPPGFPQGANSHFQEVQYVFGLPKQGPARRWPPPSGQNTEQAPLTFEAIDYSLSTAIQEYWTNFAKTGDPNGGAKLPHWPAFDSASRSFLEFTNAGPLVRRNLRGNFCELWMESEKLRRESHE